MENSNADSVVADEAGRSPGAPSGTEPAVKQNKPGAKLLKNLGYNVPPEACHAKEKAFDVEDMEITKEAEGSFRITSGGSTWLLKSQVVLDEAQLRTLCSIVTRFAPAGSVARLQADGHAAGTVYVGLNLTFNNTRIPVNLVSGDIGCGLSIVPVVEKGGQHMRESAAKNAREFHAWILGCVRRALKRGKVAEKGLTESNFLSIASAFYGETELDGWLKEMRYVLETIGIDYGNDVLKFIGRFTQSLGSSGNHFLEVSVDDHGFYWMVVHSGSRALGSKVYEAIADACRATCDGYEVATGLLAEFYALAYDALNKFAKLNRVICAIAVLDDMGLETSAHVLRATMERSPIFAPAVARCKGDPGAILQLMSGLTHNGLKAFVNDGERRVLFKLSKGAIAVDRRASSAIVALRAGEGCVVFTMVDPNCPWREVPIQNAIALGYEPLLHDVGGEGIVYAGHGAGRSQGTNETARQSTFAEVAAFFDRHGIAGNIAPGVLGDNPEKAYKPSEEIVRLLPIGESCTWSYLKTKVAHKEGLCYQKKVTADCAEYIKSSWEDTPISCLLMDFNLVHDLLPPDVRDRCLARREELMRELDAKYRSCHLSFPVFGSLIFLGLSILWHLLRNQSSRSS